MKKRTIPSGLAYSPKQQIEFNSAVKETLETISGQRTGKIARIVTTSLTGNELVLAEKVNELLDRIQ